MSDPARFDAILVPTYRPVNQLDSSIELARVTGTPLVVVCSKDVHQDEVIKKAAQAGAEAYAFDLPSASPLDVDLRTSRDRELAAASPGWNRDLSIKRNLGLVLARLLGWTRLMFLDDDICDVSRDDVSALAAALDDHSVSALIPEHFPDNSVACHAHRLGGGRQDVFASASGIGVRCDRDDLAFFPNVYNEDWFFFCEEAASHRIAKVGVSRQIAYDPFEDPLRAAQEEFGDLLAEGLYARLDQYARLDIEVGIWDVDAAYWEEFIEQRRNFHQRVTEALGQVNDREQAVRAYRSMREAQDQLSKIEPWRCQKFVELWQEDMRNWRRYLAGLPSFDSPMKAFDYLGIDPATHPPGNRSARG